MSDQGIVNDKGERILPGSRRPDGTYRKERRVRAGYIPQEEQAVYVSVGKQYMASVPKCPGLEPSAVPAGPPPPQSKSAKKNAKRKAKKPGEEGDDAVEAATQKLQELSTQPKEQPATSSSTAAASPAGAPAASASASSSAVSGGASGSAESQAAVLEKQVKALAKKLRQSEALQQRHAAGEKLSPEEQEKIGKVAGWKEEVASLEHTLFQLTGKQQS